MNSKCDLQVTLGKRMYGYYFAGDVFEAYIPASTELKVGDAVNIFYDDAIQGTAKILECKLAEGEYKCFLKKI